MDLDKIIVCPGCGWSGGKGDLLEADGFIGICPDCGYENSSDPYRLLTLQEILNSFVGEYHEVDLHAFLNAAKPYLEGKS